MPNSNYSRGVRLEREIKKEYESEGWVATRAAGSHSPFDVIAFHPNSPVHAIQAKVIKKGSEKVADRLADAFIKNPPLAPSKHFRQIIEILVLKPKYRTSGAV